MSVNNNSKGRGRPALPKGEKHKSISICITIPLDICKELATPADVERMKMCVRCSAVEAMQSQLERMNRMQAKKSSEKK